MRERHAFSHSSEAVHALLDGSVSRIADIEIEHKGFEIPDTYLLLDTTSITSSDFENYRA